MGWIAFETGTTVFGDTLIDAGRVEDVGSAPRPVPFAARSRVRPTWWRSSPRWRRTNPAWARGTAAGGLALFAGADTSLDAETGHAGETMDYLAFSPGTVLPALPLPDLPDFSL